MNKNYNKSIDDMINNMTDVKKYLASTPFINDPSLNYNNQLKEDYFFENFFAESVKAKEAKTDFENSIKDFSQIVLITGYKGCGKTTFINYITRGKRKKTINFDRLFITSEPIKSQLVLEIYDDICKDNNKQHEILKSMIDIFFNKSSRMFIDRKIDPKNYIQRFFKICQDIVETNYIDQKSEIYQDLKIVLHDLDINQLMLLIIFWDISLRITKKLEDRCNIIFDNLDAIYSTEELENLIFEFIVFYNNSRYILDNISHPELTKPNYNTFQDFAFIFAMRETTKAKIAEHFNDRVLGDYFYCDVSTIFFKNEFINKRYNYLTHNPSINNIQLKTITLRIKQILDDLYIRDNIFPLFNNDYRTIIDVLTSVFNKDDKNLEVYCKMLKSEYDYVRFGARGILFRKIFNLFKNDSYFDILKLTETSPKNKKSNCSINVSRIILTYLINYANEYRAKEYLQDKPGVSLLTIFDDFETICDLDAVITSLWEMFQLREQTHWNHLVTFDFIKTLSYEQLQNELARYRNNIRNFIRFPVVRITCAGKVYLNTVLTHYEYMAARVFGDDNEPLFLRIDQLSDGTFKFEAVLEGVYKKVSNCLTKLKYYYEHVFININKYTNDEFLGSRFAYHKLDDYDLNRVNSMFHGERIVHSHISYIDAFRKYALLKVGYTNKINI